MNRVRGAAVAAVALTVTVTGCGSSAAEDPAGSAPPTTAATTAAAPSSEAPSPSPAEPAAAPSGTLKSKAPDCAALKPPKGLKRTMVGPPTMCGFESATDYVGFGVGASMYPTTFEQLLEGTKANSDGKTVLEPAPVDGWTFGARWPDDGDFVRVQWYLVDGQGTVLECKMGSDRGEAGITDLGSFCDQVRSELFTP